MTHKIHKDTRGIIKDLIIGKKGAATYITFGKGAVRGNHVHKKTIQHDFILSGKLICYFGDKHVVVKSGEIITHPAKVSHAYKALEKSEMISLVYGPRKGEEYSMDTFKLKTPLV
jgi:mannose-6-phosphate isomerase-like protein (cupin superfamily)